MAYWEQQDLEDRIGADLVRRLLDDANDGETSLAAVIRLQEDSDSRVNEWLRPMYALPIALPIPHAIKRLSLDIAVALAALRRPEVVRRDGKMLLEIVEGDLRALRKGETELDIELAPVTAANEGGSIRSGDPNNPTVGAKTFANGTGDF